jgi:tRNA dimethylallyltransferase
MSQKTLIVVLGPTAIGKTSLAIRLAQKFQAEIISADSRQFYREMNIGTAKPTIEDLSNVQHHFINSHHINETFSVGDFEKIGLEKLSEIFQTKDVAVLVGGSGLYLNAICTGFDELPRANPAIRIRLNQQLKEEGISILQKQLETLDPEYYIKVARDNPQRLIRALEVCISTGNTFSSYHQGKTKIRDFRIIKIGLNTVREALYKRINDRVDQMIEAGLVNEVKSLTSYRDFNALNTVGYTELFDFLDGNITLEHAIELIKQNTRRFAKRQLTWFRKDDEIRWFETDQYPEIEDCIVQKIR